MVRIRTQMKQALGRAKGRMQKAGQSAFRTALPLVATLMASCAPEIPVENSCDTHNNTTTILNENEFENDRRVAGIDELRIPDGLMGEELIHAVRASHNLATTGLPEQFQTAFTQLDEECFSNPETGLLGTAYAICPGNNDSGDLGIYTHLPELTLDEFSMITHEIGHLQGPYGEAGAEANAAEHMLMLFVAYSQQGNSIRDENRWAAQATNQIYGLEAIRDALRHIYQETFRLDPDPATSMRMHPKWKYIKSDIFILESLRMHGGDFLAVREEIRNLWREDFVQAADERVERFVERYSHTDMQTSLAEIITQIRMAHYEELMRRFGSETADAYFNSNSYSANWSPEPRDIIRVSGLEGMNCMLVEPAEITVGVRCAQACIGLGATNAVRITGARFRCFTVEENGFQNWDVTANGMHYTGLEGRQITVNNVAYDAVIRIDDRAMEPIEPR